MNLRHGILPTILLAVLTLTPSALAVSSPAPAGAPVGKLGFFIGDVRCRAGVGPWAPARLDQVLGSGHELRTGKESRAELQLGQSVVRMGESTVLRLADLQVAEGRAEGGLQLLFGQLWSRLRGLGEAGLQVKSPTAVMAVRGTTFRAEAGADSSLSMWVYEGQVDMGGRRVLEGDVPEPARAEVAEPQAPTAAAAPRPVPGPFEITLDEWVRVTQGMRFTLRPDGRYALERIDEERDLLDDWVRWNQERDRTADHE